MNATHTNGVEIVQWLQKAFQGHSEVMMTMSHLGDPKNAFLIYFPLSYCVHRPTGIKVLWLAVLTEWINSLLKWVLHGERPYWWVPESGLYPVNATVIQQYRLTCETGPGSPSGHAMVTAAVTFHMISSLMKHCRCRPLVQGAIWLMFSLFLLSVNVSRVYIATHFPHQVVFGTLTGIGIMMAVQNVDFTFTGRIYSLTAIAIALSCTLTYYLILWLDLDPQWSIAMATKHCLKKKWVHLDTNLFSAVYRDAGSVAGLGIYHCLLGPHIESTYLKHTNSLDSESQPYFIRLVHIVLTLFLCQLGQNVQPVPTNAILFYIFTCVKFAILVTVVMVMTNVYTWGKRIDVILRPFYEKKNG